MGGVGHGLGEALDLMRRGDAAGARAAAEAALGGGADDAALLQFLGVICCRGGDLAAGSAYLRRALERDPGDANTRLNLVRALVDLGRLDEAEALCSPGAGGEGSELARSRAAILHAQGRIAEAIAAYERLLAADPADFEAWNNLGNARREAGDADGAVAALERAAALRPESPLVQFNLGVSLAAAGRLEESLAPLHAAAAAWLAHPAALVELGKALRHSERAEQALPWLERAARLAPAYAEAGLELGRTLAALGRLDAAEEAFRQAVRAEPGAAAGYIELGFLIEHRNRLGELDALLREAEANAVPPQDLAYLRALALGREGRHREALALARQAPPAIGGAQRAHLIGTLADRLDEPETTFAAFEEMNRIVAADHPAARAAAAAYRERIARMTELVTPQWYRSWTGAEQERERERAAPVFLVGFPRSGTTLLDTLLMGHPRVAMLEEEPILQRVEDEAGELAGLAALGPAEVRRLRTIYFAELDAIMGGSGGRLVVDKLPLNMLGAPLIHRLFPDARFVLAERHPCDVVLSCFMQNFKVNDAMASFLDLGDAARLYDRVFTHWTKCRQVLPLSVYTVRYEALVEDPEAVLRPLLGFVGLPWDEDLLDHRRTALARGHIKTPSYAQVSERLYARASGRWRRYREPMRGVLPLLAPWAERMGYTM
ncbi:MAG TPA: sulfotransferase [Allosphingosinicella sp.]|nr:sulfotransferase [Allosphingosinicella sp.]